jgi:RNA polymerase sigma factor (sigma-70 family)
MQPMAPESQFADYAQRLIGLAYKRLTERARRMAEPEDVVHSALYSFFERHTGEIDLESPESLWARLVLITLRHCGKWNKRAWRAPQLVPIGPSADGSDAGFEPSDGQPTPEEAAVLADLLDDLMRQLAPRQRQVCQLLLQGFGADQIGDAMQVSNTLAYRWIKQVREKLDERLKQCQ